MLRRLLVNQWKEQFRSPFWTQSVIQTVILALFVLYMMLNMLVLGFFAGKVLEENFPEENVVMKFSGLLVFYFLADLFMRFFLQRFPTLSIRPYLHLPISKGRLVNYLLIRSISSVFTILPLLLILPFYSNTVIGQLGVNASRQRLVDFSDYYYLDGLGFVTKQPNLTEPNQITTQRVAILNSSEAIAAMQSYFPAAQLIPVNSYQDALFLLENNQADLFVGDHSVLTGWTQEYPAYRLLPAWLEGNALAIAMPKGNQHQSLYSEIQTLMREWRESGWLQDRINHWGLP